MINPLSWTMHSPVTGTIWRYAMPFHESLMQYWPHFDYAKLSGSMSCHSIIYLFKIYFHHFELLACAYCHFVLITVDCPCFDNTEFSGLIHSSVLSFLLIFYPYFTSNLVCTLFLVLIILYQWPWTQTSMYPFSSSKSLKTWDLFPLGDGYFSFENL